MSCEPGCVTCGRLRAASLEIVGDDGVEAVSHETLARALGSSTEVVAAHYPSAKDCVYDTYDEVVCEILRDMAAAFAEGSTWEDGFQISRRRLLERMAGNPAEARLCFVETVRGDRELQRRQTITRGWIIDYVAGEHERRREHEGLPELQLEILVGAGFHLISDAVARGETEELAELEERLADVAGAFMRGRH